ncbi:MAG: hypothetical protein RIT45_3385 [Pseudomonadota bacterium]|jgi:hypothetical protein
MAPQSRRVWSLSRACALAGLALLALLPVRAARANGNHTHIGITLMAIELLPPGPLRELLGAADVRQMLVNGTIFPDGGYAIQHEYGETAHWEPFQRALAARIRKQCPDPLASQACREKAAFLFGMASHGMADQVFDALYMAAAKVHDAANWSDGLTDSFDSSTDVLWVAARGGIEPPERWLPMDDLLATFTAVGVSVPATTIEDGQAILLTAVLGFGNVSGRNPKKVQEAKARYPWGAAHLLDAHTPGSPPSEARVVASYWLQLWSEWKDGAPARQEVLATMPGDGGHIGSASAPDNVLAVVFSRGLDSKSLDAGKLSVTPVGATAPHPTSLNLFYGQSSHVVRVLPSEPWPQGPLTLAWQSGLCSSFDGVPSLTGGAVTVQVGAHDPQAPPSALPGAPPASWSLHVEATKVPAQPNDGGATDGGAAGNDATGGCSAAPNGRNHAEPLDLLAAMACVLLVLLGIRTRSGCWSAD